MNYIQWRDQLFGQPEQADPVCAEMSPAFDRLPRDRAFDYIDQVLVDADIHQRFSRSQIGFGLNYIFSNSCSDLPFCYLHCSESRIIKGIQNLNYLYQHYFDRYCFAPSKSIQTIGSIKEGDRLEFLCYMFWDIFVVYPGNVSPSVIAASLEVMSQALQSKNGNAIVSAIHGLGHWALYSQQAVTILEQWLMNPSTRNPVIHHYASQAKTGYIQ